MPSTVVPEFQTREPALFKFAILTDGMLVFFMQVGFIALEVGSGRKKNVRNILLKNTVCVMLSSLCWWACGYAFAYGKSAAGVIGHDSFFYDAKSDNLRVRPFFFGWAFMLCSNTIVSGCLAERTNLVAYPVYTIALSSIIHPLAAHWSWSEASWLNSVATNYKFLDFAGGTSVHLVGGIVGLVGAALAGPRIGRFEDGSVKNLLGHDMTFATIGTFMLWFGWYGFNCGATYLYRNDAVRRVALNTTLLGSTGGLVSLLLVVYLTGTYDLVYCCNGLLVGLVMASSTSGFIHSWGAFVLGIIAAVVYVVNSRLLIHFGVDDPLDSAAVHGFTGLLGTLLSAFFADPKYVRELMGPGVRGGGIFYGVEGFKQFGLQLLGVVVILTCTVAVAYTAFAGLAHQGLLRVDQTTELAGIDMVDHLGPDFSHVSQLSDRHNRSVHTSPDTSGD